MLLTRLAAALGAVMLLCGPPVYAQGAAEEIERLLRIGQVRYAYEFALMRARHEAGDPRFDLALAAAAIAAGHANEAVFALERVLSQDPGNLKARLELARAELMLGNRDGALREIATLLAGNPPDALRREALALRERAESKAAAFRLRSYVDLKTGYDSNVNSSTDVSSFGGYTAEQISGIDDAEPIEDYYAQLDAGIDVEKPVGAGGLVFGGVSGYARDNFDSDAYDTIAYDIRLGATLAAGKRNNLRLAAQQQQLKLDGANYRRLRLLIPEWNMRLGASHRLNAFGQFADLHYPTQSERDVDLRLYGLAWVSALTPASQLAVSVYYGDEEAGEDEFPLFQFPILRKHHGREYLGWRLRAQTSLTPAHAIYLSGGRQTAEHDALAQQAELVREDDLRIAEIGWHWGFARDWLLKADVSYYSNIANVPIFDYRRTQSQISLRRNFN